MALELLCVAALAVVAIASTGFSDGALKDRSIESMRSAAYSLTVPVMRSEASQPSNIYAAEGIPQESERGVDRLVDVMSANGQDFFKSELAGKAAGPAGIVGADDTVLIKVNGEWRYRGGTNTDVVKGLIKAIVNHPDGFTGEVVIVENGQWDSYMDTSADNQNPSSCNAQDITQSFADVAKSFVGKHRVSVYDWTAVQTRSVGEFASGDMRDGYVYVPEIELGYPKFTSVYGTRISLRHGLWNGSGYDNDHVKFINVPVLKDHALAGVTCCVKHFMGVQDLWRGTQEAPHTPMISQGILGRLMLTARYPDLNVVDAIWVTPAGGPSSTYERAVRVDKLLASTDPIALDYYCAKHVLLPLSGSAWHDPDNLDGSTNAFRQMLSSTRDVLVAGGRKVTMDPALMNIYSDWVPEPPPETRYEYLLSEGCTAHGFETWVLVANPNDDDAVVQISYMTDGGCRNSEPLVVGARSRLTVNTASCIWSMSSGIRVGSDLPVHVERAMYWSERAEGHDAVATETGSMQWFLADGYTAGGFETWIELLNPDAVDTTARITYMTPSGRVQGPVIAVPAYSRRTVSASDTVGDSEVSTIVESDNPIVVERSMYWNARVGGSCSMGVTSPSENYYFAEGCTGWGFETYLLFLNPADEDATVSVEFMQTGDKGVHTESLTVPAGRRVTLNANDVIPGRDVSIRVHADVPVVAERSMLWEVPGGRAGHASVGMTEAANEIFLTEGCTAHGFETWLLIQNPGETESQVEVFGMTPEGGRRLTVLSVAPGRRSTLRMNDYYEGDLSMIVSATAPVACERAVYWNSRRGGTCSEGESAGYSKE